MMPKSAGSRLFSLDVLRGLAAVLVLFRHMPTSDWDGTVIDRIARGLHHIGWVGVDLFFVLSGFLISTLLYKEYDRDGHIRIVRFWLRRGLKIWPAYFAAYGLLTLVIIGVEWNSTGFPPTGVVWRAIPNCVFVQNYFPIHYRWPHSWSLAIEEHFYIVLPIFLYFAAWLGATRGVTACSRDRFYALVPLAILICSVVLLLRLVLSAHTSAWEAFYYPTHLRLDSLLFGVLLGYLAWYHEEWLRAVARCWPLLVLLGVASFGLPIVWLPESDWRMSTYGFTVLYVGSGFLVLVAASYPTFGMSGLFAPAFKLFALIGTYSYTIYLAHAIVFHLPNMGWVRQTVKACTVDSVWTDRTLFWTLSIIGGLVLSHGIERPVLRLREWLFPVDLRAHDRSTLPIAMSWRAP